MNLLADLMLAIVAFASTNVDDLFVLMAFFSDRGTRTSQVVVGQFAGIAALTAISGMAALVSLVIPAPYLGLLGFAPIAIGVRRLLGLRGQTADEARPLARSGALAVVAATMATGGDNIAVYTSMFATQKPAQIALTVAICAPMTAIWCFLAHSLISQPAMEAPIRRWGSVVLPFVLIGFGLLVVYKASLMS